jgi:hypothetical protein
MSNQSKLLSEEEVQEEEVQEKEEQEDDISVFNEYNSMLDSFGYVVENGEGKPEDFLEASRKIFTIIEPQFSDPAKAQDVHFLKLALVATQTFALHQEDSPIPNSEEVTATSKRLQSLLRKNPVLFTF